MMYGIRSSKTSFAVEVILLKKKNIVACLLGTKPTRNERFIIIIIIIIIIIYCTLHKSMYIDIESVLYYKRIDKICMQIIKIRLDNSNLALIHVDRLCGLSGQSSWLQIRRPGFDSRHYQKKKVVGLERGLLMSTAEELLGKKSSGSCLENREYGRRDPSR
jgi:hypothetical protein